jgi:hypothetical protein
VTIYVSNLTDTLERGQDRASKTGVQHRESAGGKRDLRPQLGRKVATLIAKSRMLRVLSPEYPLQRPATLSNLVSLKLRRWREGLGDLLRVLKS